MDLQSIVNTTLNVLAYVLPAVFIWNLTDVIVSAIVGVVIGCKRNGI